MTDSKPDLISRLKHTFKQNRLLSLLVGCPYPAPRWNRCVKRLLRRLGHDTRILDLGAGRRRRAPNVINLEIEPTPEIDLIGDGHFLPFKDNTFDAVISEAVLEHVHSPNLVVREIYRVLKPGGYVCIAVPFLQGYHASPHDYQRWTVPGIVQLCAAFSEIESGACAGPTASLHWIFREYVGLLCSFGSPTLCESDLAYGRVANVPLVDFRTLCCLYTKMLISWHLRSISLVRSRKKTTAAPHFPF